VRPAPSFAATIKPYFTGCYRSHMNSTDFVDSPFDLWSASDVQKRCAKIQGAVKSGFMPPSADQGCEGSWDAAKKAQFLKDFQAWKDGGFQP
jgi:hypothetical protein